MLTLSTLPKKRCVELKLECLVATAEALAGAMGTSMSCESRALEIGANGHHRDLQNGADRTGTNHLLWNDHYNFFLMIVFP